MLFKIVGVALIGILICLILKNYKPEFSMLVSLICGLIILFILVDTLTNIVQQIKTVFWGFSAISYIVNIIFKIVGIGYIIEFSADLAEESGFISVASKIVIAGKIIILALILPYLINIFEMVMGLL